MSDGQKIYRGVRFFHGALQFLQNHTPTTRMRVLQYLFWSVGLFIHHFRSYEIPTNTSSISVGLMQKLRDSCYPYSCPSLNFTLKNRVMLHLSRECSRTWKEVSKYHFVVNDVAGDITNKTCMDAPIVHVCTFTSHLPLATATYSLSCNIQQNR